MPSPDANVEAVRIKLLKRSLVGLAKYGTTTERNDLSDLDWIRHAQEEAMDFCIYLQAIISRIESR
jgi:hypothetical protein